MPSEPIDKFGANNPVADKCEVVSVSKFEPWPCPFCGGTNLVRWADVEAIECNDCGGRAPNDKWNTRVTSLAEVDRVPSGGASGSMAKVTVPPDANKGTITWLCECAYDNGTPVCTHCGKARPNRKQLEARTMQLRQDRDRLHAELQECKRRNDEQRRELEDRPITTESVAMRRLHAAIRDHEQFMRSLMRKDSRAAVPVHRIYDPFIDLIQKHGIGEGGGDEV